MRGEGGGQTHRIEVVASQAVDGASASLPAGRIAGSQLGLIDIGNPANLIAEVSFDNKATWIEFRIPRPTIVA